MIRQQAKWMRVKSEETVIFQFVRETRQIILFEPDSVFSSVEEGRGTGGGKNLREAEEERGGSGIPKVASTGANRGKFCNVALHFAIENHLEVEPLRKGQEAGVKGTKRGKFRPSVPLSLY